jgi:DnaJ-class molecular chaperone
MRDEYDFSTGEVGKYAGRINNDIVREECGDCDGYGDYEGGTPGAMFTKCSKCDGRGYTDKTQAQIRSERAAVAAKVAKLCAGEDSQ